MRQTLSDASASKGEKFTFHSDTMLEPIQTIGSPQLSWGGSTPKMQINM